MKKNLIFATNNAHKLEEVQQMIGDQFFLKSLSDIACFEDIPETGNTFEENAVQKAEFVYQRYHVDCFADDSGLEVEALGNEPGVYSARYSGSRDSETNLQLVLDKLEGLSNRKARFRSVIALSLDGKNFIFEGVVNGTIRSERAGIEGFGYDPIFQPDGYPVTFAEMSLEQKNKISHRGLAIAKLVEFLTHKGGE